MLIKFSSKDAQCPCFPFALSPELLDSVDFLECDCSDASFGYPGRPIQFKKLNFGIDLDSRIASKDACHS